VKHDSVHLRTIQSFLKAIELVLEQKVRGRGLRLRSWLEDRFQSLSTTRISLINKTMPFGSLLGVLRPTAMLSSPWLVSRGGKAIPGCPVLALITCMPHTYPRHSITDLKPAACSQALHSGVKAVPQVRRQEGSRCFRAEHPAVQHRLPAMKPRLQLEVMLLAALLVSSSMLTVCSARWVPPAPAFADVQHRVPAAAAAACTARHRTAQQPVQLPLRL
jgi:hypothetical protein